MNGSRRIAEENKIRRFSTARIYEHWLVIITFGILTATGLSQKFYAFDISQWLISQAGGIDNMRLIHRYTGVVFTISFIVHIMAWVIGCVLKNWKPSIIIKKKDFTDVIHNIQYYMGMKSKPARCDRFDYKQKFEYWSVLISGLLMILSGLTLWFPAFVTSFLPGEIIPTAKTLHTNQAFLTFLIIATWHIYNSVLSPEVFPLDTTIFTGKISKERMIQEHPLEYERLFGESLEWSEQNDNTLKNKVYS